MATVIQYLLVYTEIINLARNFSSHMLSEDKTCTLTGHAIVHLVTLSRVTFSRFCLFGLYSWVARDVTKNQTKKLSILLSVYFHEVLPYLNIFT